MSDFLYKTDDWYERGEQPPIGEHCEVYQGHMGWRECFILSGEEKAVNKGDAGFVVQDITEASQFRPFYVRERETTTRAEDAFWQWERENNPKAMENLPDGTNTYYRPISYVLDGLYATGWLKPLEADDD